MIKKTGAIVMGAVLLLSAFNLPMGVNASPSEQTQEKVQNVIFLIPDGFSASYATGYRWYKGSTSMMDNMLVGMMRTYSANSEVTDSAAAGTAMATGFKTNNGMISVTPSGYQVKTILEAAEDSGKATGLVATSTITHATPAVFSSHVASRASEADIAAQMMNEGVEVLLGGGKKFFTSKEQGGEQQTRDLVNEAKSMGYTTVEDRSQLSAAQGSKLLGLFSKEGMAPELDREVTQEPSLAEMTKKAINVLNQDKDGFFLMVEGSQIDWAGHAHDAAWAMKDTEAFEYAVQAAVDFAKKDGKTLVIIAGDHDTGGMSVGGYGVYDAKIDVLRNVTATGDFMASKLNADRSNIKEVIKSYTQIEITDEEGNSIKVAQKPANTINDIISKYALVGWTSTQHTGVDVPLYAYGSGAAAFQGLHDNTEIPGLIADAMKISF